MEILRRAETCFDLGPEMAGEGLRSVAVDGGPGRLMLTRWRVLLGAMAARARRDGDVSAERDILQLEALCDLEDLEAFLPLRDEEFAPAIPRRLLGLRRLIDDATDRALTLEVPNRKGHKVVSTKGGGPDMSHRSPTDNGRYLLIGDLYVAWFGVHQERWARKKETPLWLRFYHRGRGGGAEGTRR